MTPFQKFVIAMSATQYLKHLLSLFITWGMVCIALGLHKTNEFIIDYCLELINRFAYEMANCRFLSNDKTKGPR